MTLHRTSAENKETARHRCGFLILVVFLLGLSLGTAVALPPVPTATPTASATSTDSAAEHDHSLYRQFLQTQQMQRFQLDAISRHSQLQQIIFILLLVCLALVGGLAWALWRIAQERHSQAMEDPLTGLKNRRFVPTFMERESERLRRSGSSALILMIDIDHFKHLNDHWGHEAGDQALTQIATALSHCARNADVVARWGGEEFVIVCPQSDEHNVDAICSRICNRLRKTPIELPGKPFFFVTASIGAAVYTPAASEESWTEVLARADGALYKVKRNGRDHWALASDSAEPKVVNS